MDEKSRLRRVEEELGRYEHPLVTFAAEANGDVVEVIIRFTQPAPGVQEYRFALHPRDLDSPRFEWQFQRQLYDCLHDYLVELFTRTPQMRRPGP